MRHLLASTADAATLAAREKSWQEALDDTGLGTKVIGADEVNMGMEVSDQRPRGEEER
ncbi:hypothetical protein Dimus_006388, partial [Dionaea muscipula]